MRMLQRFVILALVCLALPVVTASAQKPAPQPGASAILIELIAAGDSKITPEFLYATYEQMVSQVEKSGTFREVYRSGDTRAKDAKDMVTLRTTVGKFKQGSETERQLTTVLGWSKVEVNAVVTGKDGQTLLEKKVVGKVRFMGDNLKVTNDLGKQLAKLLRASFTPTGSPTAK
jgi:hypothetical protein